MLFLQYKSIRQVQDKTNAASQANFRLRLFELSENSKREIIDHANHIIHTIRQKRIRDRDITRIERVFTKLVRRFPEVEDCYVVFYDKGKVKETWEAYKFLRPVENNPTFTIFKNKPIGKLVNDAEASASMARAWNMVVTKRESTLYSSFDPEIRNGNVKQYFFHTVFEDDKFARDYELESIGLIAISAKPENFPSKAFYKNLISEHQWSETEELGYDTPLAYSVSIADNNKISPLFSTINSDEDALVTSSFDARSRLFPQLRFSVWNLSSANQSYSDSLLRYNIFFGFLAAAIAFAGLFLTLRLARSEIRTSQSRSSFLANISHELKTPLTSIMAFGELIRSGRSKNIERIREYGGIITKEGDRLTRIINDILDISQLERGTRKFNISSNNLVKTVRQTSTVFGFSPAAANFDIVFNSDEKEIYADYDEAAVKQVILNLLSNAVKYSEPHQPGDIVVSVGVEEDYAVIGVRDCGIGIARSEFKRIFSPFERSERNEIMNRKGTGLGLAIAKEVVKGNRGKISVSSKLGEGSVFTVKLALSGKLRKTTMADGSEVKAGGSRFGN